MESLSAIQSLAELQTKFQPDQSVFDTDCMLAVTRESSEISGQSQSSTAILAMSQEYSPFDPSEPVVPKEIDYRGHKVVGFELHGINMVCLPQVYDLFLKNMVGGLHTVYTKLKRLEITPIICNVEQVRALRSMSAIQPGVNRCKLIATSDFDRLYEDCTNTCTRPGRPPKRTSNNDEWIPKREKYEDIPNVEDFSLAPSPTPLANPLLLGQFLPQFTAQQLLMQHMMAVAAMNKPVELRTGTSGEIMEGAPLNLSKTNPSETSESDSLENMRKDGEISPNQSISDRGGSSGFNGSNTSASSDQSTAAVTKIINLIDMASDHFKQQRDSLQKEKDEVDFLRNQLKESLIDEHKLRQQLDVEKKKSNTYFRRFCKVRREVILLKEQLAETREHCSHS